MQQKPAQGVTRILNAAKYSYQGIRAAITGEAAFREELIVCLILIPIALFADVTQIERLLLISSLLVVLIVELLNSAIEAVVDRIGFEHHQLAGQAKDMGSAAVLLSIFMSLYIWVDIFVF
ncbi:diacylglycerol kinase [Vibrio spartinae]|uniref:Diacylglycerol kinase n=1 Tax=Vibrio spartinae TaxID=1918945 RepID=A0A1N6MA99_9VIBR|nr:diacylglycerol kinase [Vibrio spartinae]QMV15867.1 Diacylglycerol kinase [Vibrio spartinae]SIO96296.1 Diacylglycerol kinase [Vibrio spartinae]